MIAELLKKSFDKYINTPIEVWESFASLCELVSFKKNEVLKRPNQTEKYGYFIVKGSAGVFIWKENSYVCLDLIYENMFFADYMSLITGNSTILETRVLENTEMLRISKENIDKLKSTPMGSLIFLISSESSFVEKQQQQIDLLLKTAEQRYLELLEKQPNIIRRTAQKHIASYLGITTESLSRIRKKISEV